MKVCIVYGSKRGSTERVARAIENALRERGFETHTWNVEQNPNLDGCDLIMMGAPIYYERPLSEVLRFIKEKKGLAGKRVVVFILAMAQKFGKLGKEYTKKRYLRLMMEPIKGRIIAAKVFDGWVFRENEATIAEARSWAVEVVGGGE
ncbi:flavodoxin family protein [Thermococcus sp.]